MRHSRLAAWGPLLVVAAVAMAIYLPLVVVANYPLAARTLARGATLPCDSALACTFFLRNPVLPAPNQLLGGILALSWPPGAPYALPLNAWWTAIETVVGLSLAATVGFLFAVLLVLSRAFQLSVLPWIVASQTVPIVALAPMLVVLLGRYGVQGWLPKAIIAAYIAFFPITIGLAKGLQSPDRLALDLMKTWNATTFQVFMRLRIPASLPFLFTALKVSTAAALIGAIVGEMSTISFAGLGKMLSENARASDVVGTWVLMLACALLGILLIAVVDLVERLVTPWRR
ncbi:Riboflavin transport system permease protein RibX [bacterium HR40]|nr:Riboflavin transport system permease protein RibX [bacterium HR40]